MKGGFLQVDSKLEVYQEWQIKKRSVSPIHI